MKTLLSLFGAKSVKPVSTRGKKNIVRQTFIVFTFIFAMLGSTLIISAPAAHADVQTEQEVIARPQLGNVEYSCDSGYTLSGTTCTDRDVITGTNNPTPSCSSGYALSSGNCKDVDYLTGTPVYGSSGASYSCPAGSSLLTSTVCSKTVTNTNTYTTYGNCPSLSGWSYASGNGTSTCNYSKSVSSTTTSTLSQTNSVNAVNNGSGCPFHIQGANSTSTEYKAYASSTFQVYCANWIGAANMFSIGDGSPASPTCDPNLGGPGGAIYSLNFVFGLGGTNCFSLTPPESASCSSGTFAGFVGGNDYRVKCNVTTSSTQNTSNANTNTGTGYGNCTWGGNSGWAYHSGNGNSSCVIKINGTPPADVITGYSFSSCPNASQTYTTSGSSRTCTHTVSATYTDNYSFNSCPNASQTSSVSGSQKTCTHTEAATPSSTSNPGACPTGYAPLNASECYRDVNVPHTHEPVCDPCPDDDFTPPTPTPTPQVEDDPCAVAGLEKLDADDPACVAPVDPVVVEITEVLASQGVALVVDSNAIGDLPSFDVTVSQGGEALDATSVDCTVASPTYADLQVAESVSSEMSTYATYAIGVPVEASINEIVVSITCDGEELEAPEVLEVIVLVDRGDECGETDNDGDLLTCEEEVLFGSDPNLFDTDNDGLNDFEEWRDGFDPNDPMSPAPATPCAYDASLLAEDENCVEPSSGGFNFVRLLMLFLIIAAVVAAIIIVRKRVIAKRQDSEDEEFEAEFGA